MNRRTLLLLAALLFVGNALRYHGYLLDDAYISLRYARNLVDGHGLVFNPGERVEGYTNFLWVLAGAAFLALELDAMRLLGWVSFAAALGLLGIVSRLERQALGRPGAVPAVVWVLSLEAFGYWSWTGMETMAFTALFALAVSLALSESRDGRSRGSAGVFVLLALTRPDGVLGFGLGALGAAVAARLRHGRWKLRRPATDVLLFGAAWGAYFLWRFTYYGEPLPNTFYAKVTGGPEQALNGAINLGQWAARSPLFVLSLLVPGAFLVTRHRSRLLRRPELVALWLVATGWILYVVSVGGDFMPFLRFFLPVLPFCAVLLGGTVKLLAETLPARLAAPRRWTWAAGAALALHAGAGLAGDETYRAFVAHRTTVVGREVGRYFAEIYGPGERIAVNTAGSLPYESGLPTIDMLGLTDAAIARHPVYVTSALWAGHRRGWGEYVFERRPRAVVWYNSAGLAEPHYLGDHQLADHPYFRFFYQLRRVTLPVGGEVRPDVLARFLGAPFGEEPSSRSPELGVSFDVWNGAGFRFTTARATPIALHYFELRRDREPLWGLQEGVDVATFLDRVVAVWREEAARSGAGNAEAKQRAEVLAAEALGHLSESPERAKELLAKAAQFAGPGRSPLVYQYIANVAVLDKSLFLAVHAQQEALRYDPANELFRRNLEHLLTVRYKTFREAKE